VDRALDFFGECIAGVDDAWDVCDKSSGVLMGFADFVFAEVDVFGAFVCHGGCPVDAGLIVIVYGGTVIGF